EEESYFFKLSAYQDKLLAHYEKFPEFIGPAERRNEVISFVKGGLNDLSISRTTFDWGVPVPGNKDHVMYVWLDALTNYLSATGYLGADGEREPGQGDRARFWPADLHIIGKDIIRFHAVYWPAFLMSGELPLPKRVFAHGFLFNKGEKMSKSVGNVVDPASLINEFGVDQVRFFFLREVPFGKDGNYSVKAIINRVNADLANDIGNLAQRSLSMIAKNCNGKVPDCGELTDDDKAILNDAKALLETVRAHHDKQAIHRALEAIWRVIGDANKYFAGQEPWALKKSDPERMETVLYVTAELIRQFAILTQPYIPAGAGQMLDLLAVAKDKRKFTDLATPLASSEELPKPSGVFPRYVAKE
ncbi:MAG TPA: methionine--tRNA ligase, partial [Rhizobiales bacterium]|nr:methionine--tRNA ligase [Hyphomicrobiales bacterium]